MSLTLRGYPCNEPIDLDVAVVAGERQAQASRQARQGIRPERPSHWPVYERASLRRCKARQRRKRTSRRARRVTASKWLMSFARSRQEDAHHPTITNPPRNIQTAAWPPARCVHQHCLSTEVWYDSLMYCLCRARHS